MKKFLTLAIAIAIYAFGILSGMAILLCPAFISFGTTEMQNSHATNSGTLTFVSDQVNLVIYKDIIPEASLDAVEIEFKRNGNIVKKGTDEIVGEMVMK